MAANSKTKMMQVAAALIVVKIGKTELYLKRGAFLPHQVDKDEVARLAKIGLIKTVMVDSGGSSSQSSDGSNSGD